MKSLVITMLAITLTGCATRHVIFTPSNKPAPTIHKRGNHIWIKPGPRGTTHIQLDSKPHIRSW